MNEFNGSEQEYSGSFDCWGPAILTTTIGWGDGYVKNISSPNCTGVRKAMNVCGWQGMYLLSNHYSSTAIYTSSFVPPLFDWKLNKLNVQFNHALLDGICNPSGASCRYFWTNLCINSKFLFSVFHLSTVAYQYGRNEENHMIVPIVKTAGQTCSMPFDELKGKRACFPEYNGLGTNF